MNKFASVSLLALAFTAAACGGSDAPAPAKKDPNTPVVHQVTPAMLTHGRTVYETNCAPCHGPEGRGDGPASATLNPKPRDHSNAEYMDALTDQKIADTIRMGGVISGYPNMPSSPHIRGDDMVALIAFVRTLGHAAEDVQTVELKPQG